MTDHVSKVRRSEIMSSIKCRDTAPELILRKLIYGLGYRYRLHVRSLPGKPDLTFRGRKKVIFVHGCFWHSHECPKGALPKSNLEYWAPKLAQNVRRDQAHLEALAEMGWGALVVWQCELAHPEELVEKLLAFLG